MIGGYQTVKFAHVKRKMLHAPISMDFNHTLRSYMTRESLNLRNLVRIDRNDFYDRVDVIFSMTIGRLFLRTSIDGVLLEYHGESFANLQINKAVQDTLESARVPAKAVLMQEYNRQTIHCYTRNRERFLTHE